MFGRVVRIVLWFAVFLALVIVFGALLMVSETGIQNGNGKDLVSTAILVPLTATGVLYFGLTGLRFEMMRRKSGAHDAALAVINQVIAGVGGVFGALVLLASGAG